MAYCLLGCIRGKIVGLSWVLVIQVNDRDSCKKCNGEFK